MYLQFRSDTNYVYCLVKHDDFRRTINLSCFQQITGDVRNLRHIFEPIR
jgi:hypothetical protein